MLQQWPQKAGQWSWLDPGTEDATGEYASIRPLAAFELEQTTAEREPDSKAMNVKHKL